MTISKHKSSARFDAALSFDELNRIECQRTAWGIKRRVTLDILRKSSSELAEHFAAMTPDDVNQVLARISAYQDHLRASLEQAELAYGRALVMAEQVLPEPDSSEHVFVNYSGQSGFSVNTFGLPAGYMNFDAAGLLEDVLNERPVSSFSGSLAALRAELQDMAGLQAALSIVESEDIEWLQNAVASIEAGISRWCVEQSRSAL